MGGSEGDENDHAVDAYGVPLGENPSGFVSRPPRNRAPNRKLPGVGTDTDDKEKEQAGAERKSPFFRACFGDASARALAPSYQKQNALFMASTSRRSSSESYGAAKQRERDALRAEEDYGESPSKMMNPQLNPNAQRVANSAEGAGTALPELILRMRIINIILCTLALGLEIPFWIGRLVMANLSALVLGVVLCGFALLLCCWEMHVPVIADGIRANFGIIYHPFGRSFFFVLMGGLCVGQGGLEQYLGALVLLNAIYTIYIPCRYPHYYKAFEDFGEENMRELAARATAQRQGHAWADHRIVEEEKRNLISKYSGASGE
jgi:hypothetical protein